MARASVPFTSIERTIASNIRALREQRGMSQALLATEMGGGWTPTTVSKVETIDGANTRHLNADELVRISRVLGVSLTDLATENSAGSPEFIEAFRLGEAYTDAFFVAAESAGSALALAGAFRSAHEAIGEAELGSMTSAIRSRYEELFTYLTPEAAVALKALALQID